MTGVWTSWRSDADKMEDRLAARWAESPQTPRAISITLPSVAVIKDVGKTALGSSTHSLSSCRTSGREARSGFLQEPVPQDQRLSIVLSCTVGHRGPYGLRLATSQAGVAHLPRLFGKTLRGGFGGMPPQRTAGWSSLLSFLETRKVVCTHVIGGNPPKPPG